ncbi:MAG: response regulator [Anaerolineae bacterium]
MISVANPRRVLVVDDEPNVTLVLAKSLAKLGEDYHVDTANSAEEALSRIRDTTYTLVITDYRMPDMDGLSLSAAIREINPETQVVLMTAYGTEGLRGDVGKMELDGYLDKPFSMAQIREIVERAVGQTTEQDPYRTGEQTVNDEVYKHLEALQRNTGARCALLISKAGYPIDAVGATESLDLATIGALVAANFAAAVELSHRLGNASIFKSSYHEGPDYNIYAYDVNDEILLAVIFGAETKTGAVWFYTKQTAAAMEPLLDVPAPEIDFSEDFNTDLNRGLQQLFGTEATEGGDNGDGHDDNGGKSTVEESPSLMNLDEAVKAGLLPPDFLEE